MHVVLLTSLVTNCTSQLCDMPYIDMACHTVVMYNLSVNQSINQSRIFNVA